MSPLATLLRFNEDLNLDLNLHRLFCVANDLSFANHTTNMYMNFFNTK